MPARLSIHVPNQPVRGFDLEDGGSYVLGRGDDCDLVVDYPGISRHHARMTSDTQGWTVTDLDSKNGVSVDGQPIAASAPVGSDSWISLGGLLTHFELVSADQRQGDAERRQRRFQTSLQMQARLNPSDGLETLLRRLLTSVLEVGGAERGFVLLTLASGELEMAASQGVDAEDLSSPGFSGSVGAVDLALEGGQPVTLSDAAQDARLGARSSVLAGGLRALVCLPLKAMDRVIGVIYADSRRPGAAFTELDVEMLMTLASHAALAIALARIHQEVQSVSRSLPAASEVNLETMWESTLPRYRPAPRRPEGPPAAEASWTRRLGRGGGQPKAPRP
jgi:hypothetical protein